MTHFKLMKVLTSLSDAVKITEELNEIEDSKILRILEIKYEKMYRECVRNV
jgi:hypothetical protein